MNTIECPKCGASVSIPWKASIFKLIYFSFLMICINFFELEFIEFLALLVAVLALDNYTRFKVVPLIVKDNK
jgi:hypothetical protein